MPKIAVTANRALLICSVAFTIVMGVGARASGAARSSPPLLVTRSADAEDCPDTRQLAARLQALTGVDLLAPRSSTIGTTAIEVQVWRTPEAYSALIRAYGSRPGTRELSDASSSCSSLADAVTLAVAMLLDPHETAPKARRKSTLRRRPRAGSQPPNPPVGVELAGGVALGLLEHARPLAETGAFIRVASWLRLGAGAGYVLPETLEAYAGTLELSLAYANLGACTPLLSSAEGGSVEFCVKPMLGILKGTGNGYDQDSSENLLWPALALTIDAHGVLAGPVSWLFRTMGVGLLRKSGFSVQVGDDRVQIFSASQFGGAALLGLQAEF